MRSGNEPYNNRTRDNVTTCFASQISDAKYALPLIDDGSPRDSEQVSTTPYNGNRWAKSSIQPMATGVISKIRRSWSMAQLNATLQCAESHTGWGSSYIFKDVVILFGQRAGKSLQLGISPGIHLRPKGQSRSEKGPLGWACSRARIATG